MNKYSRTVREADPCRIPYINVISARETPALHQVFILRADIESAPTLVYVLRGVEGAAPYNSPRLRADMESAPTLVCVLQA